MNNKIISVQEMLFKEMKRLDDDKITDLSNNKVAQLEFQRANGLYNMSSGFIKTLNTNLNILDRAKKNEVRYETLMESLGLLNEE